MQPNGEMNVQEAIGAIKSTKLNIRSIKYLPGEKIDESNFQNKNKNIQMTKLKNSRHEIHKQ
jgi:hypothetical protein